VLFRIWAPACPRVRVVVDGTSHDLEPQGDGTHAAAVPATAGSRYGFRLGDDPRVLPDPASHFQPDGIDGLSEVIDHRFPWTDGDWKGHPADRHVVYELHCGTFTAEGTWRAAIDELPALARMGVTTLQLMPVNTFGGRVGWGYDGVFWYAPQPEYGRPDDLRAFVDAAHRLGLAVVLDVVYNHVGPRGSVLHEYAQAYFARDTDNEWGAALNYDAADSEPVRRFAVDNAAHWVRHYHMDGIRLDATQAIIDRSPVHVVTEIVAAVREAAGDRATIVIAENEPQDTTLLRAPEQGGYGVDIMYNDDFHHSMRVRLTGWRDAYFSDYSGSAQEWLSCLRHGFLFQGQFYPWQGKRRGSPSLGFRPHRFLCFLENHDQVANANAAGRRLHMVASPAQYRAMTALLLLGPWTPMLFQGQEYGSTQRWLYFADHPGDLGAAVHQGRVEFIRQFQRIRPGAHRDIPAPGDRATFDTCVLRRPPDGVASTPLWRLHRDLLTLRRRWYEADEVRIDASAPTADLLLVRCWSGADEYLLAVNMGADCDLARCSDPLVALPKTSSWQLAWSSEAPEYGGGGSPLPAHDSWLIAGHAATVLRAITKGGDTA
jgi:maltooligosyltrehalose trehalohydrolase